MQQFTEAIFSYLNVNVSKIKKILHRNNMLPGSFYNLRLKKKFQTKIHFFFCFQGLQFDRNVIVNICSVPENEFFT